MNRITLTIDGKRYRLSNETDLDLLQKSVLRAVRRGEFLTFTPLGFQRVSVLVSLSSSITVDTVEEVQSGVSPLNRVDALDGDYDYSPTQLERQRYGS